MRHLFCLLAFLLALPATAQDINPNEWNNPSFPVLDRQVHDDPRVAYRAVWDLYFSSGDGVRQSFALRTWLWRRDLTLLEGGTPPRMTVAEAIQSPLADPKAYREAAWVWLSKRFSIRLAVDGAFAEVPNDLTRLAPGIYGTKGGAVKVSAVVTNHGTADAAITVTVYLPKGFLTCAGVPLKAGAEGATWCVYSGGFATQAESAAYITEAVRSFDGKVTVADVAIGEPPRYVLARREPSLPPAWEDALGVKHIAEMAAASRHRDEQQSRGAVAPSAWGMVALMAALLAIGVVVRRRYASRPLVPRFLFVIYVVLVVAGLGFSALDKSTGAPMSGVLSVLIELGLGLPWTFSLLTPENHLPDDSLFPWLFTLGNAALLFIFSSRSDREPPPSPE